MVTLPFLEAAYMAEMQSGSDPPVIQPLSVTENGTYTVPEGVDGYGPINVAVPDRYQEGYDKGKTDGEKDGYDSGYADGVNSVVIKPLTVTENKTYNASDYECSGFNPVNGNVPDKYQDGYDAGYSDGYDFASDFYNNVVDETKKYTIVFYFGDEIQPGLRWIMCSIRNTADMSELRNFNWWPTSMLNCYNAKFTKIWWAYPASSAQNVPQVEISSTDSSGQNREKYTRPFYKSEIWLDYGYTPYNSNIISSIPTTE